MFWGVSPSVHSTGKSASWATLDESFPRNCRQSAKHGQVQDPTATTVKVIHRILVAALCIFKEPFVVGRIAELRISQAFWGLRSSVWPYDGLNEPSLLRRRSLWL